LALIRIVSVLYMVDILNHTIIDNIWRIGIENCKNRDKQMTIVRVLGVGLILKLFLQQIVLIILI
jgi:hypothetical protein